MRFLGFILTAILDATASTAHAQERSASDTARFYHGLQEGSESQFNPLSVVLNEGYDISQLDATSKDIRTLSGPDAFTPLNRTLSHPIESIRRDGTWHFISTEIIPTSVDMDRAQWVPNYQLHLIGGGMVNARLEEWYIAHGAEHPKLLALATSLAADYLNEASEMAGNPYDYSTDPIADMYVFNLAGIAMFQSDAVRDFFSREVVLLHWPLQPSLGLHHLTAENAGDYYVFKFKLPWTADWRLFYHVGLGNIAGFSRRTGSGKDDLTLAAGYYSREVVHLDRNTSTVKLSPKLGLFWDRDNSLMASLFYNAQSTDRLTLNVYPSRYTTLGLPWGFWMSALGPRGPRMGVVTTIGLGATI